MPELAEVKIMGDFVNYVANREMFFSGIEKSQASKVKTDLDVFQGNAFKLSARTRGKEMLLEFSPVGEKINGISKRLLCVTMGMSGSFVYVRQESERLEEIFKHAHLKLRTVKGNYLVLHDVRRFAKWKWSEGWNPGRGYCPLTEFNQFSLDIRVRWAKHKVFNTPLNEILMNQALFNGVGNYLRSEILYRLDLNPFQPIRNLSTEELDQLLKICHLCCRDAYYLGGGQIRDWVNPQGTDGRNFGEWMKCYGKGLSVVDGSKRRFWYDPKWQEYLPESYKG